MAICRDGWMRWGVGFDQRNSLVVVGLVMGFRGDSDDFLDHGRCHIWRAEALNNRLTSARGDALADTDAGCVVDGEPGYFLGGDDWFGPCGG